MVYADIYPRLAVINGFVEIPNSYFNAKTYLTPTQVIALIPGSEEVLIARQHFVQLPYFDRADKYPANWFQTLNDQVIL
jgi:hypothetical protein